MPFLSTMPLLVTGENGGPDGRQGDVYPPFKAIRLHAEGQLATYSRSPIISARPWSFRGSAPYDFPAFRKNGKAPSEASW